MRTSKVTKLVFLSLTLLLTLYYFLHIQSPISSTPKSALVALVKPQELYTILDTVRNVEDRWNHRFRHDWVFLSEQEFNDEFRSVMSAFVSGSAQFRTINRKEHWRMPESIDRSRLLNDMRSLEANGVQYGGSTTYRLMCRFQAGFFMEYLPEYRYYARIDPDVKLYCDIEDDIFAQMHSGKYKLGYTMALRETPHAIHDLSRVTNEFMKENPEIIHEGQWLDTFIRPWDTGCHFWTNFEIGDLEFFRSSEYKKFFEHLDDNGGIFYNRWGDSPIHSVAASLFLNIRDVHWFSEVGNYHAPNIHCPTDRSVRLAHKCACPHDHSIPQWERNNIFTYKEQSCIPQFLHLQNLPFEKNWEDYADKEVLTKFIDQ